MAILVRKDKAGRPRYFVRLRDELGKWYPTKTFNTIREANFYDRKLKERKDKNEHAVSKIKRNLEFHVYLEEWLESRRHQLSIGWFHHISKMSKKYILPRLGRIRLVDLRSPHIGQIMTEMNDLKLSDQTRLHVFNILNKSFKDAVEYFGYLEKSPVFKQDRPKVNLKEKVYLTPSETWKLLEICKDHYLGPAIWICALAGLRISEIQALQWKNVDFEKRQILICAAYKRGSKKIEPYPKQKNWLIVPIPAPLIKYLKEQSRQFPLAFTASALQGGMLEQKKFYHGLRKLCKLAGVKQVSPHGLRHSCTEVWIKNGATVEDIRQLLGHKCPQTTLRYIHRTDERLINLAKDFSF